MRRSGVFEKSFERRFIAALCVVSASLVLVPVPLLADRFIKQVEIEARFVTVTQRAIEDLGLDRDLAKSLGQLPPAASNLSSPNANNLGLGASPSSGLIRERLFPDNEPGELKLSGLLTEPQFQVVMNAFKAETSAKGISAPVLTARNNQRTQIEIPSSLNMTGVNLSVIPQILPDGRIQMAIISPEQKATGGEPPRISDIPVFGALMRGKTPQTKQNLLIFVTPHLVDALSHSTGGYEPGDEVQTETVSTGKTIDHIADLKIKNMTNGWLVFMIPPVVFESKGGRNQASCCPRSQKIELAANQTKIVPMNGICLDQKKPAAPKGTAGELVMNTGDPRTGQDHDLHISADKVQSVVHVSSAIYDAVDEMAKNGSFKDFPYRDKEEQKRIALQWCTWSNPRVAELTGGTPATKEDMKTVAKKQHQPENPGVEKKIDKGIDTIWEKIELTSEKAKSLDESPESKSAQSAGGGS